MKQAEEAETAALQIKQTGAGGLHPLCRGRVLVITTASQGRCHREHLLPSQAERSPGFPLRDCLYLSHDQATEGSHVEYTILLFELAEDFSLFQGDVYKAGGVQAKEEGMGGAIHPI